MRMTLNRLESVKEGLEGSDETEERLNAISAHFVELEKIIKESDFL
jgi:hypothetical protein